MWIIVFAFEKVYKDSSRNQKKINAKENINKFKDEKIMKKIEETLVLLGLVLFRLASHVQSIGILK